LNIRENIDGMVTIGVNIFLLL